MALIAIILGGIIGLAAAGVSYLISGSLMISVLVLPLPCLFFGCMILRREFLAELDQSVVDPIQMAEIEEEMRVLGSHSRRQVSERIGDPDNLAQGLIAQMDAKAARLQEKSERAYRGKSDFLL